MLTSGSAGRGCAPAPDRAAFDLGMGAKLDVLLAARGEGQENRRKKPVIMKKAPETGASEWNLYALVQGVRSYFFFFGAAFFFAAFLVAVFID